MLGLAIVAGLLLFGWAAVMEFRSGRTADALGWIASGLLLALFLIANDHGVSRWLLSLALIPAVAIGLTVAWRAQRRTWRGG